MKIKFKLLPLRVLFPRKLKKMEKLYWQGNIIKSNDFWLTKKLFQFYFCIFSTLFGDDMLLYFSLYYF